MHQEIHLNAPCMYHSRKNYLIQTKGFKNGEDLTYFDGQCFKSDSKKEKRNSNNNSNNPAVSNFAAPNDMMTHYETAPSMAFGRAEDGSSKTSKVPYKQIDGNTGKQIFASDNDMNILNIQKKRKRKKAKNKENVIKVRVKQMMMGTCT